MNIIFTFFFKDFILLLLAEFKIKVAIINLSQKVLRKKIIIATKAASAMIKFCRNLVLIFAKPICIWFWSRIINIVIKSFIQFWIMNSNRKYRKQHYIKMKFSFMTEVYLWSWQISMMVLFCQNRYQVFSLMPLCMYFLVHVGKSVTFYVSCFIFADESMKKTCLQKDICLCWISRWIIRRYFKENLFNSAFIL